MALTTNYNLKKPATSDYYNVDDWNGNMDIIDAELKKRPDAAATQTQNGYMAKEDKAKLDGIMCGAITIPISGNEGWAEIATSFTTPVAVASAQILAASDGKVIVTAMPVAGSKIRISIYSPTIPNANINVAYIIMDAAV